MAIPGKARDLHRLNCIFQKNGDMVVLANQCSEDSALHYYFEIKIREIIMNSSLPSDEGLSRQRRPDRRSAPRGADRQRALPMRQRRGRIA